MSVIQNLAQTVIKTAVELTPERWLPGGSPDALMNRGGNLGKAVSRVDGWLKVSGHARFAAELKLDGMVYAAHFFSSIARGRIAAIETTQAEEAEGVVLVMTFRNAPRMKVPPLMMSKPKAAGMSNLPIMQDDQIHWNGQPIAVVLAETQEQADYAASLIRATYEQFPAMVSFAEARTKARVPDAILGEPSEIKIGDAEAALIGAHAKVDQLYATPRHNHNAIELHAATVAWNDDQLTVHDATQSVNATAWTLAQVFGLEEEQVHVLSPFVGGSFGGEALWNHQILAAAASRLAGRPVRMSLSREGVFRVVGGRTQTLQRVALAVKVDGTLAALIHTGVAAMTVHNDCPEQFSFPVRHLYAADWFFIARQVADMDMLANTYMRAPGESVGTFALESALDELAHELRLDPVELRRRIEPVKDPTSGAAFSSRNLLQAYTAGAEKFGWDRRLMDPGARREGEWLIGMGMATATYPYFRVPGGTAGIRLTADGRAIVQMANHEMGMGTATAQAQHAAERLGSHSLA